MEKKKVQAWQFVLFAVTLIAIVLAAAPSIKSSLRDRQQNQLGGAGAPGAGGPGGFNPQQMAARRLEQMTQRLQLSAEQRAKIQAINDSFAPRFQAIRDDASLSRQQRREKMQPIRAESDAQIKQVLTAEQQTKFEQMQAERRARFAGGGAGGGRGGAGGGNGNVAAESPTNPPPPAAP